MDYILAAIVGWCGTGWPIKFPPIPGGGGTPNPDDPWPPNCPACGRFIGSLAAMVILYAVGPHYADAGMLGKVTLAFFGGSFGASLIGGIANMATKKS